MLFATHGGRQTVQWWPSPGAGSSAWVRGTHYTAAVAEIVAGYGFPESAIVPIVVAECALVALYLVPQAPSSARS